MPLSRGVEVAEVWESAGRDIGFSSLYDFAFDASGAVWLADYRHDRLCHLSPEGVLLNVYDQITTPHGIFVDYKKRIASGFRYTVRCPICEIRTSISDHLTNFRVVQGSSGW